MAWAHPARCRRAAARACRHALEEASLDEMEELWQRRRRASRLRAGASWMAAPLLRRNPGCGNSAQRRGCARSL